MDFCKYFIHPNKVFLRQLSKNSGIVSFGKLQLKGDFFEAETALAKQRSSGFFLNHPSAK